MKTAALTLCLALLAPTAAAGGLVVFRGAPGAAGDVMVVPTAGAGWYIPQGLDGVRLLGLEVNGRTELERFLPGKAWLETDVPFASRAVLPQRRGSVYRYRRDFPGEGSLFGFFKVDAGGDAWRLFELPGTGATFDEDPFLARVAIAPDGLAMLVATTAAAGGDLFELGLGLGGGVTSRTDGLPPLVFLERSLTIHTAWGVAVTQHGIVRFSRPGIGDASFLTYNGTPPDWWSGDLVLSRNGAFAAAVASGSAPLGQVWVFGPTTPAQRASEIALPLSGAGFLPEALHGPYLAVSDDGAAVAWRMEGLTREGFLAKVQPPPGQAPQQISSDAFFLDTLDELGQYAFKPNSKELVVAVGALSANLPATLESADYFAVTLDDSGAPVFTNITQTNGLAQPPFNVAPQLDPLNASWTPKQDALVFHDDKGGNGGRLAFLRPAQTGVQLLLDEVKEVQRVDRVGGDLVAVLRRSTGNKDLELHFVDLQPLTTRQFFVASDLDEFPARAVRSDNVYTFVQRTPTFDWMWAYDTRNQALGKMTQRKLRYAPTLAVGPDDEVGFSVGQPGLPNTFGWWSFPGAPKRLALPAVTGFLLPGI